MTSKFYTSVENELKLKDGEFLGLIPTFVEITEEKTEHQSRNVVELHSEHIS